VLNNSEDMKIPVSLGRKVLQELNQIYQSHANGANAAAMKKYLRNQFEFYGIKTPQRKLIQKSAFPKTEKSEVPSEEDLRDVLVTLWDQPQRELQYFALGYARSHLNSMSPSFLETLKYCVTTKSWWDTVDAVASQLVGPLVLKHPILTPTMEEWINSENMWLRRTAIIHQLSFKKQTNEERLFAFCVKCASEQDFFIRKAIGWALREYSKTSPKAVKDFVKLHKKVLSPLSRKEALKRVGS